MRLGLPALGFLLLVASVASGEDPRPVAVQGETATLVAPFRLASLNRLGTAAFTGTPGRDGSFLPAFDRDPRTEYVSRVAGPAHLVVAFAAPQEIARVQVLLPTGEIRWSVTAGESGADLASTPPRGTVIVPARERLGVDQWETVALDRPVTAAAFRFDFAPVDNRTPVRVRDIALVGRQELKALSLRARSQVIPLNDLVPLEVLGYFSGGEEVPIRASGFTWVLEPRQAARMSSHNRIQGRRRGPVDVRVRLGRLESPPLPLEVD